MDFNIYDTKNAKEESKPLLEAAEQSFGFIPNLLGEFAEAPAVLEGYLKLDEIVGNTSFSPTEQQAAILAASIENECTYCSAVHSTVMKNQMNVDEDIVNAIRNGEALKDAKLNALVDYTQAVVRKRGKVSEEEVQNFHEAGYSKQNILEINLIVALKTISNYTNHIANTPLDEAFKAEEMQLETA
jgi:uncharacterized peroxidase-related enzyme